MERHYLASDTFNQDGGNHCQNRQCGGVLFLILAMFTIWSQITKTGIFGYTEPSTSDEREACTP